jgi:hypothetical protein
MNRYGGPKVPYYSLEYRPLLNHYNGPLWTAQIWPYYSLAWRPLIRLYIGPL